MGTVGQYFWGVGRGKEKPEGRRKPTLKDPETDCCEKTESKKKYWRKKGKIGHSSNRPNIGGTMSKNAGQYCQRWPAEKKRDIGHKGNDPIKKRKHCMAGKKAITSTPYFYKKQSLPPGSSE